MELDKATLNQVLKFQQDEIDGYEIYKKLALLVKDKENSAIIAHMSADEYKHYRTWRHYSGQDRSPNRLKVSFFLLLSKLFGYTFGIKLLEKT